MARVTSFALALGFLGATSLVPPAVADQPRVLGLDFEKISTRDLGLIKPGTRLDRRAGTITASLSDAQSDLLYLISVGVGTPAQSLQLQLDTGSSDLWVPSKSLSICSRGGACTAGAFDSSKSSSFVDVAPDAFSINYVDGTQIQGDYFKDVLALNGSTIQNMTMGLATRQASATTANGLFQGIVGAGFEAGESVAQQQGRSYPSFLAMLKTTGLINTQAYSLWLNDLKASTGSILFGGVDTAKYHGNLAILPIQPDAQSGALTSFTVELDNIEVIGGGNSTQYKQTNLAAPVVLDSGTTLTYLPDNIADDIARGVGAYNSQEYGVVVPCNISSTPATINFGFGAANGATIAAPIGEFVLPFPSGTPAPKFRNGQVACLWGILPAGSDPMLLGDTFLRSAYVVYNLDGQQIGLAQANFFATSSNVQEITETSSIPNAATTVSGAMVTQTASPGAFPTGEIFTILGGGGGSSAAASTVQATGTFNLGQPTSTSSKSAANALQVPPITYSAVWLIALLVYPTALALAGAAIAVL